jgi:hypothetical protein
VRGSLGCGCSAGDVCANSAFCNGGICTQNPSNNTCGPVGGAVGCYCSSSLGCDEDGLQCIGESICAWSGGECEAGDAGCQCDASSACRDAQYVSCQNVSVLNQHNMIVPAAYCVYLAATTMM